MMAGPGNPLGHERRLAEVEIYVGNSYLGRFNKFMFCISDFQFQIPSIVNYYAITRAVGDHMSVGPNEFCDWRRSGED